MYWHNQTQSIVWPSDQDPIAENCHNLIHHLYYHPCLPIDQVQKLVTIADTCQLANQWLKNPNSLDLGSLDKVLNMVRINQFVHSLRSEGNYKPILVYYNGQLPLIGSTGGTRLMAAELCPEIQGFSAFISTHSRYKKIFQHLEMIPTFSSFASKCNAPANTNFLFRFTDAKANYGLDWYEVDLQHTYVPNNATCLSLLNQYLSTQPKDFEFEFGWFGQNIDWNNLR